MPSLNLNPTLSVEPGFCMFIINGYDRKSKRLQSLDFVLLFILKQFPVNLRTAICKYSSNGSLLLQDLPRLLLLLHSMAFWQLQQVIELGKVLCLSCSSLLFRLFQKQFHYQNGQVFVGIVLIRIESASFSKKPNFHIISKPHVQSSQK